MDDARFDFDDAGTTADVNSPLLRGDALLLARVTDDKTRKEENYGKRAQTKQGASTDRANCVTHGQWSLCACSQASLPAVVDSSHTGREFCASNDDPGADAKLPLSSFDETLATARRVK